RLIARSRCTLLGVGPMSRACVDAAVELANEHNVPLFLIASRRQVDSAAFGGGYVNRWTTAEFARHVLERDAKANVILARDHGGPWQNEAEVVRRLGLRQAMQSAKESYQADIDAGFQMLHIDTSVDIHGGASVDDVIDRMMELYEFCWARAQAAGREILFEIGTEEQTGSTNSSEEELDHILAEVKRLCEIQALPPPTFVVVQTGTRVMETRNVGSFDSPVRIPSELAVEIQLPKMLDVCHRHGVMLKEHNTDYLSDDSLKWHPRLGIHAANVAPEFGVAETRALLGLLEVHGMAREAEEFVAVAVASGRWKKWLLPDSRLDERGKAEICGHYVFSDPRIEAIRAVLADVMARKGLSLDTRIRDVLKAAILRYMRNFRLVTQ
ncbi:MAG: class II D-tagatose-bisphosphate aldolase, non-catalytic subunit, partial [Rhodocyclaceae bacterium]|nr:class II D-tagatose-bisphosphate aldolase, non-catalytic subunit [Rhodocyclaceae bacterium]